MKKIPYGLSDFKRLKTENYFFIDKTKYLEIIENYNSNYLMFLRPRRFGKSLFIAILEAYYDIYFKDEFETIFKDTYILNNQTKEASSYMVLKFDFSAVDIFNVNESFKHLLQIKMETFIYKYKLNMKFKSEDPISMLNFASITLFELSSKNKTPSGQTLTHSSQKVQPLFLKFKAGVPSSSINIISSSQEATHALLSHVTHSL